MNKRIRDLMNDEDTGANEVLHNIQPLEEQPKPSVTNNWSGVLKKLDASGPPLKKGKPKAAAKLPPVPYGYMEVPAGYFDPYQHGYCLLKSELMYKTPDGVLHKATGVDTFGPFKTMPVRRY